MDHITNTYYTEKGFEWMRHTSPGFSRTPSNRLPVWLDRRNRDFCSHLFGPRAKNLLLVFRTTGLTPLSPLPSSSLVPACGNSLCWTRLPSLRARRAPRPSQCQTLSCAGPASWPGGGEGRGRSAQAAQGAAQSLWTAAPCVSESGANRDTSPCPLPWLRSPFFLPSTKCNNVSSLFTEELSELYYY